MDNDQRFAAAAIDRDDTGHCRAEESELRSEDVFRAPDGMKFMFQMAYLFPTMTGDNADDNADSGKKKSKFKRPAAKS